MIQYPMKIKYDKTDKCYLVEFPDLPGCVTFGDSLDEAQKNAKEALTGYLESIDLRKISIPIPSKLKGKNIFSVRPEKNVAFAIWLKTIRIEKGYTQKAMAKILDIKLQSYQRYENPVKTNPTLKTISKIENVFNEMVIDL